MYKRIISFLLCVIFLMAFATAVYADETEEQAEASAVELTISTREEFLVFAENCRLDSYSRNMTVILETDIDLTGSEFECIPVFSGTFEGNGNSVTGLNLTADGSAQGLFRYLTAYAVVRNLNVAGDVNPGGSRSAIGGIAGENEGSILGCSFYGTVSGGSNVGGLAGINGITGIIENSSMDGQVHGSYFIGGIAGENRGVIRECVNNAPINTTAQQNAVSLSDITMDTLTNSESVNAVTDIGGIAGSSSGVIRSSENRGGVGYQHMGYNIGGIAGTQSGYIVDCINYGDVQGRKEVGGIAGQMEPASLIEYSEDTLQILRGQLGAMSGLVNQASSNAQTNAGEITGQISVLQEQAQTAREAVDTLFPDGEDSELPDVDTILAAQNTLSSTIGAMPGTLNSIAAATQATVSGLTRDLQAISGQIRAMGNTINEASENMGGSITDISDQDTAETLTGKVEKCANEGGVLADMNVGGIAGAMAMENDLDILEDWETSGENSLNFQSEVRAVVLDCENRGVVTGGKQNAGGIVGWQSLGLVKSCINTGTLDTAGADYVGGISGLSSGFVRSCGAKCEVAGGSYVGGIAGCGTIVTDCRSIVAFREAGEKRGAVLGFAEECITEEETPVSGNFYLITAGNIGAVDGIDYDTMAQPLELDRFLSLADLPEALRSVAVRFVFEDGTQKRFSVTPGGSLDASRIPTIPEKEGFAAAWEGLAESDLTSILFDLTFEARYTAYNTTISGPESRSGRPVLLVQGDFAPDAAISMVKPETEPTLADGENLLESWQFEITRCENITAARCLLPADTEAERLQMYVRGGEGDWRKAEFTVDGSYVVFALENEDDCFALTETEGLRNVLLWLGIISAAVIIVAAGGILIRKKKVKPDTR